MEETIRLIKEIDTFLVPRSPVRVFPVDRLERVSFYFLWRSCILDGFTLLVGALLVPP